MINLLEVICYKFRAISKCPISKCEISKRLISKRLISKCLISKREISKRGISKRDFGFQVSFFQVGLRSGITPPRRDDCPPAQYSSGTVSRARTLQRDSDGNMTPVMISPILRQNVGKITVKTVNSPVENYQNSQVPLQKYDFLRSSNRKDAMISQASEKVRSLHAQLRAIKQHDMKMSKNHAEEIEILQARFAKDREAIENAKQEKKEFFQKTLEDRNSDIASMKAEVDFFSYEF